MINGTANFYCRSSLLLAFIGVLTLNTACTLDSRPVVSLEEAKEIAADREVALVKAPPRSISNVHIRLGKVRPVSRDCGPIYLERESDLTDVVRQLAAPTDTVIKRADAGILNALIVAELSRGNYVHSMDVIESAISNLAGHKLEGMRAVFNAQLARIHAFMGDAGAAADATRKANRLWRSSNKLKTDRYRRFSSLGEAVVAGANGELASAEAAYRELMTYKFTRSNIYSYIDETAVSAELARNLLLQEKLLDAEIEARKAIQLYYHRKGQIPDIDIRANLAEPTIILAKTLIERRQLEEAEYVARMAVFILQFDCAWPDSLALAEARKALGNILEAQGAHSEVIDIFEEAASGLGGKNAAFERLYGDSISYGLALVHQDRIQESIDYLNRHANLVERREGPDSIETAMAYGALASALAANRQDELAMQYFIQLRNSVAASWSQVQRRSTGESRSLQLEQMLESYLAFISRADPALAQRHGIAQVANETFVIANFLRSGSLQKAVVASASRIAARDPETGNILRLLQDTEHKIGATQSVVRNLESAPSGQVSPEQIKSLRTHIEVLKAAETKLNDEIAARFPSYRTLVSPKPASLEDAVAALRAGEALIDTYSARDQAYVWAVPKEGEIVFAPIPLGRLALENAVTSLRQSLNPNALTLGDIPAFDVSAAHDFYSALLEPVESGWSSAKTLLYVAHGPLGRLPISVLPTDRITLPEETAPLFSRYQAVPWLGRKYAIATVPSVRALATLRQLPESSPDQHAFVGFADPWFDSKDVADRPVTATPALESRGVYATRGLQVQLRGLSDTSSLESADLATLPRLPDTYDEIVSIALTMNADLTRDIFTGPRANESQVKSMDLAGYKVIAFATHGLVPGDLDGLTQPALALSAPELSDTTGDGLLTMSEIFSLRLDADWVVLSACNTASGDGAGAEALSGLGLAFFYAGARALLASSWPVETTSAKILTTDLFRRQAEDVELTRAGAHRDAMIGLIDGPGYLDLQGRSVFSYAHPIFWAPFILIGDPGN